MTPDDMYNVTPMPDLEDDDHLGQYIQDRRVLGVRQFNFPIRLVSLTSHNSTTL